MSPVLRKLRGAIGMAMVWAIGWAVIGGGIMEGILDPNGEIVDIWPVLLAIFGFLGGLAFSVVLGIAARRRRFSELSLAQFTVWGAVAGIMLGIFAISVGVPALFLAFTALGCALSAAGSLKLARAAEQRDYIGAGATGDGALSTYDSPSALRQGDE